MASHGCYKLAIGLAKVSILFQYLLTFPQPLFRKTCWATVFYLPVEAFVYICVVAFQCVPLNRAWDLSVQGTCANLRTFWIVDGSFDTATNLLVICVHLPVAFISLLSTEAKTGIFAQSGLGLSYVILSAISLNTYC